ncbi:MAG TPA: hypothetical protein VLD63_03325 [Anaerolineales bacterium]|nr:hypothetical protein [Anaerolineales bacterium]
MEAVLQRRLAVYHVGLWVCLGVTLALAVTLLAGDLAVGPADFPYGWATLWLLSIIAAPPLGIVMLIGPVWRTLPLARRRATAIGYLIVGGLDLGILAAGIALTLGPLDFGFWLLPLLYAVGVALAILATHPPRRKQGEELFP